MQRELTATGRVASDVVDVESALAVEMTRVLGLLHVSGSLLVALSLAFPWWQGR